MHQVETMFYAGERPWHGLGKRVEQELTARNAIIAAGLDWKVQLQQVFARADTDAGVANSIAEGYRAVVRDTDKSVLGIVGTRYHPIQNDDAFGFFDEVVGSGQAVYHTAGSLKNGRLVWILAKLPGVVQTPGVPEDVIEKYILLNNWHDGTGSLSLKNTPVRVVCNNTNNMALRGSGESISIRHYQNIQQKVAEAQRALKLATSYYDELQGEVDRLCKTKFSDFQMKRIAEGLFPVGEDGVRSTRAINNINKLLELFSTGKGQAPIRGTAYAAYNAVTEYADHNRGGSDQGAKLESIWFGSSSAFKQRGLNHINQLVTA